MHIVRHLYEHRMSSGAASRYSAVLRLRVRVGERGGEVLPHRRRSGNSVHPLVHVALAEESTSGQIEGQIGGRERGRRSARQDP